MLKRVLSSLVLIPVVIFTILKGGYPFFILTLLINIVAILELNKMFSIGGVELGIKSLLATTIIFLYIVFLENKIPQFLIPMVFMVISLRILIDNKIEKSVEKLSYSMVGFAYITLPLTILLLMRNMVSGEKYVMATLISLWSVDSFAYLGGMTFGKHKLSKVFSPKKSVEGLISGFIGAFLVLYFLNNFYLNIFTILAIFIFSFIMTLFGQCGDLIESCFKRNRGIKDSGNIIPGHGGILDRVDSMLFSLPIAYLFFILNLNLYS